MYKKRPSHTGSDSQALEADEYAIYTDMWVVSLRVIKTQPVEQLTIVRKGDFSEEVMEKSPPIIWGWHL